MKYIYVFVIIYFLCSCKNYTQSTIDNYGAAEIYIDTNVSLVYQKDTVVYDTARFFFLPKIKSENKLYNIQGFDTNCFCQKHLPISSNKKYCTIECFELNNQTFLLQKTKSLIIDLENYKVIHTIKGNNSGEWNINQWYKIEKKIGFDKKNYSKRKEPKESEKIKFVKTYSIQSNILLGFTDSTNFNVKNSEQIYTLFHNPFIVIDNQYFKVSNSEEHHFLDYEINVSTNHDFIHLNTIDIGYVGETDENELLHSRYYCVIIDIINAEIATIMNDLECDGKWDNNNWVYTKLYKEFPKN